MNTLESRLETLAFVTRRVIAKCRQPFEDAAAICEESIRKGGKLIVCGNGGSAAQAEHLVAELVGRFTRNRPPIPALCLGTSHATVTALANDLGYRSGLTQEFAAVAREGDVLVGFSTSGESENVVNAFIWASLNPSFPRISITGGKVGNALATLSTVQIAVPILETAAIQEAHLVICHALAEELESRLQNEPRFRFFGS